MQATHYISLANKIAKDVMLKTRAGFDELPDLQQEAYLGVCIALNKDRGNCAESLEGYVVAHAYGRAREYVRNKTKSSIKHAKYAQDYQINFGVSSERVVAAGEILEIIDNLPEKIQRILYMLHVDEMKLADIALKLSLSPNGAWKIKKREIEKIRRVL